MITTATNAPRDPAPYMAAAATAAPLLIVAVFWSVLGLLGGNGMSGPEGTLFLFGHVGAGVLALLLSPWLAARLCRRARRRGWYVPLAVASASTVAIGVALLILLSTSVALAALAVPDQHGRCRQTHSSEPFSHRPDFVCPASSCC